MTAAPSPRKLILRDVCVAFGTRNVVSTVSAEMTRGECIAVVGPNGAGKTSLLRAIAGLVTATGYIHLDAQPFDVLGVTRRSRLIAYLAQQGTIAWPMRVRDIVALGRLPFGASAQKPTPADTSAIDRALALCDLAAIADRPATRISGGERVRTLLARCLAVDAPILLLDEPVASLDPAQQLRTMDLLAAQARDDRLVVAVLHDLSLALRYCSRLLVMHEGRLVADGAPRDLLMNGALEKVFRVQIAVAETPLGPAIVTAAAKP